MPDFANPPDITLSSGEMTVLLVLLCCSGALFLISGFIAAILKAAKVKAAEKVYFWGFGVATVLLVLCLLLYIAFDFAELAGWKSSVATLFTWVIGAVVLFRIGINLMDQISQEGTVFKPKIILLALLGLLVSAGIVGVPILLLVKAHLSSVS